MNEEQLRAYQHLPKPGSLRLIDFERTEIVTLESFPPQFVLEVSGTKPYANLDVDLMPFVYVQQPLYWEIEVVGTRQGLTVPVPAPYRVSIPLDGISGTRGVEVVGATRRQRFDVPERAGPGAGATGT